MTTLREILDNSKDGLDKIQGLLFETAKKYIGFNRESFETSGEIVMRFNPRAVILDGNSILLDRKKIPRAYYLEDDHRSYQLPLIFSFMTDSRYCKEPRANKDLLYRNYYFFEQEYGESSLLDHLKWYSQKSGQEFVTSDIDYLTKCQKLRRKLLLACELL